MYTVSKGYLNYRDFLLYYGDEFFPYLIKVPMEVFRKYKWWFLFFIILILFIVKYRTNFFDGQKNASKQELITIKK